MISTLITVKIIVVKTLQVGEATLVKVNHTSDKENSLLKNFGSRCSFRSTI
jgi:hypothetical protein